MKFSFLIPVLPLAFISCSDSATQKDKQEYTKIAQLDWVLGNWKDSSANGVMYERWVKANDSVYTGIGVVLSNGDTVFSEKLAIEQRGEELFYIPTVSDQNEGKAVFFKLAADAGNEFIFENKTHDFPQRIIYKRTASDSLFAVVEGMDKGVSRKEEFFMGREKR